MKELVFEADLFEREVKINVGGLHLFIYLFIRKRVFREGTPGHSAEGK